MVNTLNAPERLEGNIKLPSSKSISNRVLIIHALTGCELPQNLSDCDDTDVVISALKNNPYEINIKAAGTAMRFMTAYLSVCDGEEHVITGTERMKHRPIGTLVDALRFLGANIEYAGEEGFPPLRIRGSKLDGGMIDVSGSISSQYISALLLIGPMLSRGLKLHLNGTIISRPYIDLTLWTMREFGAQAEWTSHDTIVVEPGAYKPRPYYIENDWSAASYWYELMALCKNDDAEIVLKGLTDGSKQGDSQLRYIFSLLGVKTAFKSKSEDKSDASHTEVRLRRQHCMLQRLDYDFGGCPDLAQTFVVCCCMMDIPFRFEGLRTLRIKETDRIAALMKEMRKLGYVICNEGDNVLYWEGEKCDADATMGIDTYEDHRMAMAFAPAAFRFPGLKINNPEVVSKSYPKFWEDLKSVNFTIE